jgi:predicted AlkP superfamily phosphohydrolase/phosphomutase
MGSRVTAIALDAADWRLLTEWAGRGLLPNFARIIAQGSSRALDNHILYANETPWSSLLTGCSPEKTGYWTPLRFQGAQYRALNQGAYSFEPFKPFFATVPGRRVTVFDLPHCGRLFAEAEGVQVLGWGAHSPMGNGRSLPAGLFRDLRRRFGAHPAWRTQDRGSWWDSARLRRLRSALLEGIERRCRIHRALLAEHPADLTLLAFSEVHIAGHHFWHLGDRGHPAAGCNRPPLSDFLLDIYRATDRALGDLLEHAPSEANVLVFSPEGGAVNSGDLNSMVFLPELLFRWNFPGRWLLADGAGERWNDPAVVRPRFNDWVRTVWSSHYGNLPPGWVPAWLRSPLGKMAGLPGCNFPFYALRRLGALQWQPASWYRPWWPRMKAFALPSYGDGCIRINLKGREPHGIVAAAEYDGLCRELCVRLKELRDPRSGSAVVRDVIIVRDHLRRVEAGHWPDADLVVLWQPSANDMIADATAGSLGPAPFWKSGSHRPTGFVVGLGPDIARGAATDRVRVTDLAPTILRLLGVPPAGHHDGRPIFG